MSKRQGDQNEKPSDMIAKAAETAMHTDARGRAITAGRINALQYYRLVKAMGAQAANEAAMEMATIACSVRKIDALNISFPQTETDVEFLMQQLDFDGIAAAGLALAKLRTDGAAEVDAAKN